jgi:tetratricopeptide (TPR) repeat protein
MIEVTRTNDAGSEATDADGREGTNAFINTSPPDAAASPNAAARVRRWLDRAIFRLLLVLLVAVAVPYGSVDPWWDGVAVGAVFALGALWMIEGALGHAWLVEEHKTLLPLAALVSFALAQALPVFGARTVAGVGVRAALSADPFETQTFALKLCALVLFAAMLLRYTSSARRIRAVVYTILAVGLLSAMFGFARWALTKETLSSVSPRLAANLDGFAQFINRNHFALLVEIASGAALGLLIAVRRKRERLLVYATVLLVLWVALVMSTSRGGILGACAALATATLLYLSSVRTNRRADDDEDRARHYGDDSAHARRHDGDEDGARVESGDRVRARYDDGTDARVRRRRHSSDVRVRRTRRVLTAWLVRVALAASVVAFALAGVLWAGGERLAARLESVPAEMGMQPPRVRWGDRRTEIWRASWKLFIEHPAAGVGFGAYRAGVTCCHDASGEMSLEQAHDEYLELLASGGVIAAALIAWQIVLFARRARRTLRSHDSTRRALAAGALASVAAVAVHSLFDFGLHITANAFLFAALAATVVVGKRADEAEAGAGGRGRRQEACADGRGEQQAARIHLPPAPASRLLITAFCLLPSAFFVWGAWHTTRAGVSRLLSETATRLAGTEYEGEATRLAAGAARLSPADPEAHYALAVAAAQRGDEHSAVAELERAAALRPGYYLNWLRLGRARERAGDTQGALDAYGEAVRLAPAYAEPRWQAGNTLLRAGRLEEAFAELRRAASSRPALLPYTAELAWRAYGGDAAATLSALAPESTEAHIALARFFVRHGEREVAIEQYRAARGALNEDVRRTLVSEMFTAGMFREAREVWADLKGVRSDSTRDATTVSVKTDADFSDGIFNGSFESQAGADEPGFDWRIKRDARAVAFSLDGASPHGGARSLIAEFEGEAETSARLVSQTILVEPGARYTLRFAARTEDLKSGGMPVVAVLKTTSDETLAQSESLPSDTAGVWREFEFEFRAPAEAVTIVVRRAGCPTPVCPIFGRAWFDDFTLRKL